MTPSRRSTARLRRGALAVVAVLAAGTLVAAALTTPATAGPVATSTVGQIIGADRPTAIPGSYLVVLKDSAVGGPAGTRKSTVTRLATDITHRFGVRPDHVWGDALNGFSVRTTDTIARRIATHPAVAHVEADQSVQPASVTQFNAPWNLDRLDQYSGLDSTYTYESDGSGVRAYVIDSGIRITHQDFGGQAEFGWGVGGYVPNCHSPQATHIAATIGGTTFGVAKDVVVVDVRITPCTGGGGGLPDLINGISWVVANHLPGAPAVANLSLIGALNPSVNTAVANLIADGITVVVPAGNSNANACSYSPASLTTAITVGATQSNDSRASFSNYGTCLDLFAPGVSVMSASNASNTAVATLSGTAQSTGNVAGAAARVLEANPTWTPAQVHTYLTSTANPVVTGAGTGSPARLLHLSPLL
ncbi:S8 family peptidase [Micromonospora sp. NPDC023956]|uniref:S8 family peptidase n=1 Tax=Micromonospora sp. NPDC023956 TaxID=3155722 RepID=UPI0033CC0E00